MCRGQQARAACVRVQGRALWCFAGRAGVGEPSQEVCSPLARPGAAGPVSQQVLLG